MAILANGHVTISIGVPSGDSVPPNWLWLDPDTGKLYYLKDGNWTETVTVGLTGSRVIDGKRLTFTNGLLTGYEVV